jgi:hypothetical protein
MAVEVANSAELPCAPAEEASRCPGTVPNETSLGQRLRDEVSKVLEGLDLQSTTLGQVRAAIATNLGLQACDLEEHKAEIRSLLEEKIQAMQGDALEATAAEAEEQEGEAQTPQPKSKDKKLKRKRRMMQAAVHLMKKCRKAEPSAELKEEVTHPELQLEGVEGPLRATIAGVEVDVPLKTLYSGRPGFHTYRPLTIEVGGKRLEMTCMISCAIAECKDQSAEEQKLEEEKEDNAMDEELVQDAGEAAGLEQEAAQPPLDLDLDAAEATTPEAVQEAVEEKETEAAMIETNPTEDKVEQADNGNGSD